MSLHPALAALETLGQAEKLEALSRRFGTPHIPDFEQHYFRALFRAELEGALRSLQAELAAGPAAPALAARGRVRRLLGDVPGAAADLRAALDLEPAYAPAHAWLAELDLRRPEAEAGLSRALELDPSLAWARLYRGAARLLAKRPKDALGDLAACESALGRLLSGLALSKLGRKSAAAKAFGAALELNPSLAAAALLRARCESGERAFVRACESAFDADPDYAHIALFRYEPGRSWSGYLRGLADFAFDDRRWLALCVRSLLEDSRYSAFHFEAVGRAERLLALHPKTAWGHALLGRALSRCPPDPERRRRSLEELDRAVELAPRAGWTYAWRALARAQAGRPEEAVADLDRCLQLSPYYYRAYGWRGAVLRKLGRPAEAVAGLDRSIAVDERYPFSLHERSLARRALGDAAGAALDLDRAFLTEPRYAWVYAVGREASREELAAGVAELDAALERHPSLPSLWTWRGELKLRQKEYSAAFADLEAAIHLDPHHALAWGLQGRGLSESGRPERAAAVLKRAVDLEPGVMVFRAWLAEAEERRGRFEAALAVLGEALRLRPRIWWLHTHKARCLLAAGRPRKALPALKRALELEGRDVEAYYLQAQARLSLADLKGAEKSVEKALAGSPNLGRAYILRAEIRQRLGRYDGVLEDYRTVFERFPYLFNDDERKRVEALLHR